MNFDLLTFEGGKPQDFGLFNDYFTFIYRSYGLGWPGLSIGYLI